MQGIYQIKHKSGKRYIGSSVDIARRFYEHKWLLKEGKHHSIHLQNAYNLYGLAEFEFLVIREVERREDLLEIEQWYLDNWDCVYNVSTNTQSSMRGRNHTERALKLISEASSGENNPRSKATSEKISSARELYSTGNYTYSEIIDELNLDITEETLGGAINGNTWRKAGGPILGEDYEFDVEQEVLEIRRLCATQEYTDAEIGDMYGKSAQVIGHIAREVCYSYIGGPIRYVDYGKKKDYDEMAKETIKIREMAYEGQYTTEGIAEIVGVSPRVVRRAISGARRKQYPGPIKGVDYKYPLAFEREIISIREMFADGYHYEYIGDIFGRKDIHSIVVGRIYDDIGGPIRGVDYDTEEEKEAQVLQIRQDYYDGLYTMKELGDMHGKTDSAISAVLRGDAYADMPGPIKGVDYGE